MKVLKVIKSYFFITSLLKQTERFRDACTNTVVLVGLKGCGLCHYIWQLLARREETLHHIWTQVLSFFYAVFRYRLCNADIQLISDSGRWHLRSASDRRCIVPHTQNTFGDRSFCVAGPRVWNRLPGSLRREDISYRQFTQQLKSCLFV